MDEDLTVAEDGYEQTALVIFDNLAAKVEALAEITDEEWRAFQAIPDQGYSHRGWIEDNLLRPRLRALLADPEPDQEQPPL